MARPRIADATEPAQSLAGRRSAGNRLIVPRVEVLRNGRVEPLLPSQPTLSSLGVGWSGIAVEHHSVPACEVPRHEHFEHFLHVVLRGTVKVEVLTRGRLVRFEASPGTTFLLPRGTIDQLRWEGPTDRIAVAIHPSLLVSSLDETADKNDIELSEHWNLTDPHIAAVLRAMTVDLGAGSPAGQLYGESLANALAIYLLHRYAVRPHIPAIFKGGLPRYRLKRVLDYIGDRLPGSLSLAELSGVAGMSPHYFTEMFRQSTGLPPHRYVLLQRIERAKESLLHRQCSVIEAGLDAGFRNPSHFARMFRKFVGVTPSEFRSEAQR
jgi:AraC family transcriptional regulator